PARTDFDWLSRDPAEVDRYVADPHCGFRCTTGLWLDLLEYAGKLTEPARLRRIPKSLPVLLMAGGDDPVCAGPRGPRALERSYRASGLRAITTRIYPQGRHELFNDLCREEATAELISWIGNHLPAAK
ncbi:MAG: alpha/beta hydrolase, partial [Hydrocarboniphaga effusa]|nr:alpha/beta hydrolase [Hydrocarboniphaga effusa]